MKTKFLCSMLLLASTMMVAPIAGAATYRDCSTTIQDNVSGAVDCEISSVLQDQNPPAAINEDGGFFDINTWLYKGTLSEFNGGAQSGSYDFSSLYSSDWDNVMLVFKDGNADTSLVGYLLGTGVTSGTWTSPFEYPSDFPYPGGSTNPGAYDVSYIRLYYTTDGGGGGGGGGGQTPEPTMTALMGIGLFSLAMTYRRRVTA